MEIAVSRVHFPITTLGPGHRVGVWFQGCSLRCPGCISVDTWAADQGVVDLSALLDHIAAWAPDADGITISGGEPFEQPEALANLLSAWRSMSDTSTFVYTGREWPEISDWIASFPSLIDAVMTGPFRSDLPQTLALRGSDNQQLHVLSDKGSEFRTLDRPTASLDRHLDVMFDERGHAWFAGIPARGELGRLRRALALAGHDAKMSDSLGNLVP